MIGSTYSTQYAGVTVIGSTYSTQYAGVTVIGSIYSTQYTGVTVIGSTYLTQYKVQCMLHMRSCSVPPCLKDSLSPRTDRAISLGCMVHLTSLDFVPFSTFTSICTSSTVCPQVPHEVRHCTRPEVPAPSDAMRTCGHCSQQVVIWEFPL